MKQMTAALVLTATAFAVHAGDGVVEINAAKVAAAGGYPFIINQPGSYRLTSDLVQPTLTTDVIRISVDNVNLDLNGFSITGSNVCSISGTWPEQTMNCTGAATGHGGIVANGNSNTVIRNGSVSGLGGHCITLIGANASTLGGDSQIVDHVQVSHCSGYGIAMNAGSVQHVSASASYWGGLIAYVTTEVADSSFLGNAGTGLNVITGTLERVVASSNLTDGINLVTGSVTSSTAAHNQASGFSLGIGGTGVTATANTAESNAEDGFVVGAEYATLIGNNLLKNANYGVRVTGTKTLFAQNIMSGNTAGTRHGPAISAPANSNICNSATC